MYGGRHSINIIYYHPDAKTIMLVQKNFIFVSYVTIENLENVDKQRDYKNCL